MKKALLLALLSIMAIASATAQQKISGTLIDRDSKEPVPMVTVQLLKADSAFVSGSAAQGRLGVCLRLGKQRQR